MKASAGRGFGFAQRIRRRHVIEFGYLAGLFETLADVIALLIDVGIDLVRKFAVPLIFFDADVVRSGAGPERNAPDIEWRLPDAEVMARGDDAQRVGLRVSESLRPV